MWNVKTIVTTFIYILVVICAYCIVVVGIFIFIFSSWLFNTIYPNAFYDATVYVYCNVPLLQWNITRRWIMEIFLRIMFAAICNGIRRSSHKIGHIHFFVTCLFLVNRKSISVNKIRYDPLLLAPSLTPVIVSSTCVTMLHMWMTLSLQIGCCL